MTRGIIEEIIDKYHVRVRIPEHNGLQGMDRGTPTSELGVATICCPPGHVPHYRVGDIVFVAYERGNISMPVVVGLISGANSHYISSDIDTDSLKVNVNCELPQDTNIGNVTKENIQHLLGTRNNIQRQIDLIVEKINAIIIDTPVGSYGVTVIDEDLQFKGDKND